MELLGVDDLEADIQTQETITEVADDDDDDTEYDPNRAAHLVNGVIARIDSDFDD